MEMKSYDSFVEYKLTKYGKKVPVRSNMGGASVRYLVKTNNKRQR